jgi:hypothetical protein
MPAQNQYEFYIIERESLEDLLAARQFIEGEYFNIESFWIYSHNHKSIFSETQTILRRNKSWDPQTDLYGMQESSCLEVSFNQEGFIESVILRIDFGISYIGILIELLWLFRKMDLVIIDEDLHLQDPNFEIIDRVIQSSKRWEKFFWGEVKE